MPTRLDSEGAIEVACATLWSDGDHLMRLYNVVVERDPETGLDVGYVPGWPEAYTQGVTLDELEKNLHEVITMLLEDRDSKLESEFVGLQMIRVA